jgi:hypothetical protein
VQPVQGAGALDVMARTWTIEARHEDAYA